MARLRRALAFSGIVVGAVLLALLWGRLEPQSAPPWLVELSQTVTTLGTDAGRASAGLVGPIRLAVAVDGPVEGAGRSIVNGVRLFVDELNARGGVDGVQLEIDVYDDQGEIDTARQVAREIVAEGEAVAVVGHRLTATSVAAGPIYRDAELPVITPTATHPDVTRDNPWSFRTIYDDDHLGRFIAHYVRAVLQPERTLVVSGAHAYGRNLRRVFLATADELDLAATGQWLDGNATPAALAARIDRVVALLREVNGPQAVFFATYPEEAVELIRRIRDAGLDQVAIVTPDSFDRADFGRAFDSFVDSRRSPGFYTDGIDVATPLIFDTAGREAGLFHQAYRTRFDEPPDWRAAFAYDAAQVIAEALARAGGISQDADASATRLAIRQQLVAMDDVASGFSGITGHLMFDARTRSVPRPAAIGRFHGRQLVSEFTQFKPLATLRARRDWFDLVSQGKLLAIGDQLMNRVEVVYTGLGVNEIRIDHEAMTFEFEGVVWFRFSSVDLHPEDIVFVDALGPIEMTEVASQINQNGSVYRKFEISGTFRLDPIPELRRYGEPMIGIGYYHKEMAAQDLIYVVDFGGMGIAPVQDRQQGDTRLAKVLEGEGWRVTLPALAYQDTEWIRAEGAPDYLDSPDLALPHSMFVAAARVVPVGSLIGDALPQDLDAPLFLLGGLALLVSVALGLFIVAGPIALGLLITQLLALAVMLLAGQGLLFSALEDWVAFQHLDRISELFRAAWWLLPAIYAVLLLNRFFWPFVERKTLRAVPRMIKILCASVILLLSIFGVIGFVYDQPITSLLATSGLVTLIIGLAAQTNLSNVFAGIVLSAERPFALADVVEIEEHGISRVTNMTWRTTRLVTPAGFEVSVPNGRVAEGFVRNYSRSDAVKTVVDVWLPPSLPIDWASEKIRAGIEQSPRILREPAPGVEYGGVKVKQNQWAMHYQAYFFIDTPFETGAICSEVSRLVWGVLAEAGVTRGLGTPGQDPDPIETKPTPLANRQAYGS